VMKESEFLGLVKNLAQEFPYLPLHQCQLAVHDLLEKCQEIGTDLEPDVCKALITFVVSVVAPRCAQPLNYHCLEILGHTGKAARSSESPANRAELHGFFFKLLKKEVKTQRTWKPKVMLTMLQCILRWSQACQLSRAPTEGEGACSFDVVASLLQALYGEMGRCERWNARVFVQVARTLERILCIAPQVLEHAITRMKKDDPPALLTISVARTCSRQIDSPVRASLLEVYPKLVLEAKQPISDCGLEAWKPMLATVTVEELDKLLPVATRMSKRQPGPIAHSVPSLCSHVTLDLTNHAKDILEPLALEILKMQDKRKSGQHLIKQVVRKCLNVATPVAIAEGWAENLKKAGKADDKQAVLLAIGTLVSSLPARAAKSDLAGIERLADSKSALVKISAEDSNEETRTLAYRAVGALLFHLPQAKLDALLLEMVKSLQEKKTADRPKLAGLEAIVAFFEAKKDESGVLSKVGGKLVDAMIPVVTLAATKPAQRLQSLLAWAICSLLAARDPESLSGKLKKDQLAVVKDGPSFLNNVPTILKAPYPEAAAQSQLWRALLCGKISGMPSVDSVADSILSDGSALSFPPKKFAEVTPQCRTVVVLLAMLHGASPERDEGSEISTPLETLGLLRAVSGTSQDGSSLLLLLAHAFVSWLAELAVTPLKQVTCDILRATLIDLCRVASALEGKLKPEAIALLVLAVHHPLLSSKKWPTTKLWAWLQTRGPLSSVMTKLPSLVWTPLSKIVLSLARLPASDPTKFRRAGVALAKALDLGVACDPASQASLRQELTVIVQQCAEGLHSEEVEKESEENISIFFAPEGILWREEGTYVAEEREDKNVKRNKYLKDLYGDDDISLDTRTNKPAPKAKTSAQKTPGKDAKSKAKSTGEPNVGKMTASDIEAARIAEQSEVRARIRIYLDEVTYRLEVLAMLAESSANTSILENSMPMIMHNFLVLLKSPLTTLQARQCLRALVKVVAPDSIVQRSHLLPDALTVVAKGWFSYGPQAAGTPGDTPVCQVVLDGISTSQALPAATLSLILPLVLRALVNSSQSIQELCKKSLLVLENQLLLGAEVPESMVSQIFDALGTALLALPGQRSATQAAMLATGSKLITTEDQLTRLADMFFADDDVVRSAVIAALAEIQKNECILDGSLDPSAARTVLRLGILEPSTETIAQEALEALDLEADEVLVMELIDFAQKKSNVNSHVQGLIAKAVAQALDELREDPAMADTALDLLTQLFREDAASRVTVAKCLECMFASNLDGEQQVIKAFRFLLRQALGLTSSETPEAAALRDALLTAGMSLVEKHGKEHAEALFEQVEDFEDSGAGAAAGESARLGVAVFLGALSKHLGQNHPKVPEILPRLQQRLLEPTSTPSVQNAIVKVMPPLMKQNEEKATEILNLLMETALGPKTNPVTRRGAAMGVGATVKGLSIKAVSQHGILKQIEAAAENKKEHAVREGALLCLEGLTLSLGRLFDPYVVSSLPLLLQAFADPQQSVRNASQSAASTMMAQLSGPGVKQVLKPLLEGIKDKQWRTKVASIDLLSSMTNCLPKQLAACLPQVVPALCVVINDQHVKVKDAARIALDKVGNIISSPELRVMAPDLIEALTDGAQFEHITKRVLDQLLGTSFVHHIDAPSLSLACPLVQQALKERSAEMKRKGAQIVGSMVLLIKDPKDIQPYLPLLLPQLKVTLVDPIPDVRATAAKAFGTLANGLPEEMLGDVLPWLFGMLRSSESAVERSGAAHGLSEVLMAMGTDRIEMLLPDILSNATNKEAPAEVKEGYLGLFVYLPVAMGNAFEPYLIEVLNALLKGVSDDTGAVRDTAYRAAQVLTKQFGASHTAMLLSPLEEGVFDTDWRIRHASVQLMGQLIEQILRAHRIPTNSAELMQCEVLPKEWREHMLASLYIVRSDENGVVKQACAQVWKAVVQNTPRTLKELLPALMRRLIANLASENREKQRVAARCVGDLVGKLGERVMPELMPIFMTTLSTGDAHVREGVCIGLAELINATTRDLITAYLSDLIPAIRQAIIDDVDTVRNSASIVVALLHNAAGPRATTDVVTWVLAQLLEDDVEDHGHLFLNGLEQLMEKQPNTVLQLVLSRLTSPSPSGWKKLQVQGLACLAVVPDAHTIHRHLSEVLPVMITVASDDDSDEGLKQVALDAASRVMERVEQAGLTLLFNELSTALQDTQTGARRAAGARLFERFFDQTSLDVVPILPQAIPAILAPALNDEDSEALAAGVKALSIMVKKVKTEELAPYLSDVRDVVLRMITDPTTKKEDPLKLLPGLCECNGLEPLHPIYQQGLMFGSPEARELAAKGLRELVDHTTEKALKPWVVKITGPLIRVVGDKYPGSVKKAILDTLKSLLIKGGATLKPFLPQLQTTYVKCLADPAEAVKEKAAESLGTLVRLAAKSENLIKELTTNVASHADAAVRHAMCIALGEVLCNVLQPATDALQEKIFDALLPRSLGGMEGEREREAASFALAMAIRRHAPPERVTELLEEDVVPAIDSGDAARMHSGARVLAGVCWCQDPQLPPPSQELTGVLQGFVETWLPSLIAAEEAEVRSSAVMLLAGAARLYAATSLPWERLAAAADKLASIMASGRILRMPCL